MGGRETPVATQVAVLETRRLLRQSLCVWLNNQSETNLVGSAIKSTRIATLCQHGEVDAVLVGVDTQHRVLLSEVQMLARRYPDVRFITIADADMQTEAESLLDYGFRAVVPASAGTTNLVLRVINADAVVRDVAPPLEDNNAGPLTREEAEVLELVGQGSTAVDISEQLGVSPSTVANRKERIFSKLQANNQAHAVARAVNMGIIAPSHEELGESE